jgi:hypothetical protein
MLADAQREYVARVTATLQIIVAALAFGVLTFAGIALLVAVDAAGAAGGPAQPLLTYIAAGAALVALVLSWIVPGLIAGSGRQAIAASEPISTATPMRDQPAANELGDVAPLLAAYQTRQIVRAAILEGAAFFCLISYIIEKQSLSLVAAGIMVLLLLGQFPTRSRVEDWIGGEMAAIEQLRQMRPVDA